MNIRYLFLLPLLFATTSWAEFSSTDYVIHPRFVEANEPFIIDILGEWSTDCHPGEQKPVVTEYTGDTAVIEFETIVEHDTCNDVVTPFRVLVDMSDVVGSVEGEFQFVDVTVRYGGDEYELTVPHICNVICSPAPQPLDIKPEAGLYHSDGLEKQGLLLARQNLRMAAYPLIYDESGSSEWLFAGGGIREDAFFADLYELTGGQCLGCPPPADTTQMNVVGKISMVVDREGLVQVRVNDGLFVPYEQSEFGYGSRDVGGEPNRRIPDFSGRWAFIDDSELDPGETRTVDPLLPLVFDIRLESVEHHAPPITSGPSPLTWPGHVIFSIRDKADNVSAQMLCAYVSDADPEFDAYFDNELVCEVSSPDMNNGDPVYKVRALSKERLWFNWAGGDLPEFTPRFPTAVRID